MTDCLCLCHESGPPDLHMERGVPCPCNSPARRRRDAAKTVEDPFASFATATNKCAECGGNSGAHFVFCRKLDEPKRLHNAVKDAARSLNPKGGWHN